MSYSGSLYYAVYGRMLVRNESEPRHVQIVQGPAPAARSCAPLSIPCGHTVPVVRQQASSGPAANFKVRRYQRPRRNARGTGASTRDHFGFRRLRLLRRLAGAVRHWMAPIRVQRRPCPVFRGRYSRWRTVVIGSSRGTHPVTVKQAALGSCPGFGIVRLEGDGSTVDPDLCVSDFTVQCDRHQGAERDSCRDFTDQGAERAA